MLIRGSDDDPGRKGQRSDDPDRRSDSQCVGGQAGNDRAGCVAQVAPETVHADCGVLASGEAGSLRVGASTTPGIYLVPEVLGRFRADLPWVNLAFRIANSAEIQRALLANELDLGIAGPRFDHDELFEVMLGKDRILAIASPSLLGRIRRLRIEDLARWPLLARERGSGTQAAVAGALAKRGARIPPAFELPLTRSSHPRCGCWARRCVRVAPGCGEHAAQPNRD